MKHSCEKEIAIYGGRRDISEGEQNHNSQSHVYAS